MKPRISKVDGHWTLTRPGYGFNPAVTVTSHPSWRSAMDAALPMVASAGPLVERGGYTLPQINYFYRPQRGTIRMEGSSSDRSWLGLEET